MIDWKITRQQVPLPDAEISEAVRRSIARDIEALIERSLMDVISSSTSTAPSWPPPPLTAKGIVQAMAEAAFDAEIIISDYAPADTRNKDGVSEPVAAFKIDQTKLPDWHVRCAIAAAKGERSPKPVALVFPGVDAALAAIDAASRARR